VAISAVQRIPKGTNAASISIGAGDGWATPTTGNLLVVSANSDATVTITGTWTLGPSVVDGNGTYLWYRISDGTESTITCTPSVSDAICITAAEYSGATASPFDVQNTSTIAGSAGTTTTAVSVTTTAAADLIIAAACIHTFPGSLPTSPTWTNSFTNQMTAVSGGAAGVETVTFYAELIAGAGGGYSTSASWTNSASDRQQLQIAFKAAATTATFPPYWKGRRLLAAPRLPRGRMSTPTRAQVNPPFPFAEFHQPRRLRGIQHRRAGAWTPTRGQVNPPLPFNTVKQPKRQRGQNLRRGEAFMPVPAQVVVTPPTYPPQSVRTRLRGLRLFRGHAVTPVPAQVTVLPPAYVPQTMRARVRSFRLFRGRSAQVVPAQVTVQPPAFVAGKARQAVIRQAAVRRGHITTPPPAQSAPTLFERIKLRAVRLFRGKPRPVVPAQVILIAPPYPPLTSRARRNQFAARRHRGGVEGWMVPGVHLCVTPRPNTGTTGRPGSGTTAYNTATTSRPGTGITARPNSGTTQDPC
jgi:hypothetical protein